ncbi:hypothetical protein BGZ63DRAFT_466510 [Mariannaea sp. PMI_226]|nr:hypothetical protein BGZ63DRAFT_466510 [Mariannaea sp. PMI_226]
MVYWEQPIYSLTGYKILSANTSSNTLPKVASSEIGRQLSALVNEENKSEILTARGLTRPRGTSDFSLAFTLKLSKDSSGDQAILVKSESAGGSTPMHIKVTSSRQLQLSYWAVNESGNDAKERNFYSSVNLASFQRSDGSLHMELKPDSVANITAAESKAIISLDYDLGAQQTHGPAQGNDAPLCLGGASWSQGRGLRGIIGSILLYSSAIQAPKLAIELLEASGNAKGIIGSWSCRDASEFSLVDDLGRNHGKFKGDNLHWILSPYKPDLQLSVFVNATRAKYQQPNDTHRNLLTRTAPAGPRQLTLRNASGLPRSSIESSINFRHNRRCTDTYSSRFEHVSYIDLSLVKGAGAKWQVRSKCPRRLPFTFLVNNEVRVSTTNVNMEMGVQLTGVWKEDEGNTGKSDQEEFEPLNTGLALVASEMRGPIAPLVAYQMRPNPDPKDRNLVSFEINSAYTKQGCLDGRRGLTNDPDYPVMSSAPKDASYYKPVEAYALRERTRRAEEQRQGEFNRREPASANTLKHLQLETNSAFDMVQSEIGGNLNIKMSVGASFDMELAFGNSLGTVDLDAMYSAHFNFNMTKEKTSNIRYKDPKTGKYVKRPGDVDAFGWMSFWLEPSVEATDTFFEQVIDPVWLEESPESNAQLLRSLCESLAKETSNARTKARRALHHCTYVSRVPERVELRPAALANVQDEKNSTLLADVACNWLLIQKLELFARGAESKARLAAVLKPHVTRLFPSLISQARLYVSVLNLVADYIGLA